MRTLTLIAVLALAANVSGKTGTPDKKPRLEVTCEFEDGSRLKGAPSVQTVFVRTDYARLEVMLATVRKLTLDKDHETVKLEMRNGDTISGVLDLRPFRLRTLVGDVPVSVEHLVTMTIQSAGAARLNDGLVSYFDFEDDFAATRSFRSRVGHELQVCPRGGNVRQQPGVRGQAVALHNATLDAATNPTTGTDHLSVALWFKTSNPTTNYKLVSAAWWQGGNRASGWVLGTHYPEAWADDDRGNCRGDCAIDVARHFKPGEWNHVAFTYDREHFRQFINGKLVFECASSGFPIGRGANLVIGGWMGFPFDGLIDELRVYDRALSTHEIEALNSENGR